MYILRQISIVAIFLTSFSLQAQIVTTDPPFPKPNEPVTIYFDASQGNAGLAGLSPGTPVYVHTGLITNTGAPDVWQFITGNWGTADNRVRMTRQGLTDIYTFSFIPNLRQWYNDNNNDGSSIPGSTQIEEMAFVFRDESGNREGKTEEFGDIFVPVYDENAGLLAAFFEPRDLQIATSDQEVEVLIIASQEADIQLSLNGSILAQTTNDSLLYMLDLSQESGDQVLSLQVSEGMEMVFDTLRFTINPPLTRQNPPAGTVHGINYIDDSSIRLALYAPEKELIHVLGDFNNWKASASYFMNRGEVGTEWEDVFWLDITGLTPNAYTSFQYLIDGNLRVADPYSTLTLDPNHDGFIRASTWPNLPEYPDGGQGILSLIRPGEATFNWQVSDFDAPADEDLVIYELLVRDFVSTQNYQTILDTLDYLAALGVNALQFMPVNEFDGNESWGYNPTFHMALDKYYGTPEAFKKLVDACHLRGIAVILDVVYNQAHERCPLAQMYWDQPNFRPAANSPFLNQEATHPFNVFFDFNHESEATQRYVERVVDYWLDEYKIDGFRFDLSKGFTQRRTTDVGVWSAYDASRIAILKNYADSIWAEFPDAYVILEHLGVNSEEKELADYGMMLWAKMTDPYNQATMGFNNSDLSGMSYQQRGWNDPHLIGYMESHDEERLMYKNLQFGNSSANYNIKSLPTALARMELAYNFFLTIPGPKMIWQFGELGYDYSIFRCGDGVTREGDGLCRLAPKPIRWDYADMPARKRVYDVFSNLMDLRARYPETFQTDDFDLQVNASAWKRIQLNNVNMNATILGNFNVVPNSNINPNFQHTGWWYEFYSGDSIMVDNVSDPLSLQPGEYRLYTDVNIGSADIISSTTNLRQAFSQVQVSPNPVSKSLQLKLQTKKPTQAAIYLYTNQGKHVTTLFEGKLTNDLYTFSFDIKYLGLAPGTYYLAIQTEEGWWTEKFLILQF